MPPAALTWSRQSSEPLYCATESTLSEPVFDSVMPMVMVSSAKAGAASSIAPAAKMQSLFISSSQFFDRNSRARPHSAHAGHIESRPCLLNLLLLWFPARGRFKRTHLQQEKRILCPGPTAVNDDSRRASPRFFDARSPAFRRSGTQIKEGPFSAATTAIRSTG